MTIGVEAIGVLPIGAIREEDSAAVATPYALVFENPDTDVIYLVELETRPPQE